MIITTEPSNEMKAVFKHSQASPGLAGFTMLEVLIATSVSAIVLASIVATFITFAIGARAVGAYSEMSQSSRGALEYFARDVRSAENVIVANESSLVVVSPASGYHTNNIITYDYDKDTKLFLRVEKDSSGNEISNRVLLNGVEQFTFSYFDPLGKSLSVNTPSILLSVKGVQVDAELLRSLSRAQATDYIISARFMMRNRPVTE
ncbi:MAG: PilW family protein [Opitutales bacterium]